MTDDNQKQTISVSDDDTQYAFKAKMQEIEDKRLEKLAKDKARQMGVNYISLTGFPIAPEVLGKIDEEDAARAHVVCFFHDGSQMRVASTDPQNPDVADIVRKLEKNEGAHVEVYMISEKSLFRALELYKQIPKHHTVKSAVELTSEEFAVTAQKIKTVEDVHKEMNGATVTRSIAVLLGGAVNMNASDIHLEAEKDHMVIRYRIDGVLHDVGTQPLETFRKLVSRIKSLAGMKLNIDDVPQDGNIEMKAGDEELNLRVSTLPTNYGESIVMRLLRGSAKIITFEGLGLRPQTFKKLEREIKRSAGMVITTGPTGSGKTTTLYAMITTLNTPENKVITLEDPIEYQLPGISQSEIHQETVTSIDDKGQRRKQESVHSYSFAKGLRSILRQDPDIIMVGEIRDLETAETAIQSALTGHLVLSTIHTNDAAGAIPRFLSMGVKPFLLAPALNAVIGQRLVRRLCEKCKEPAKPDNEKLARAKEALDNLPQDALERQKIDTTKLTFYKGKGCHACGNLGYKGRIGIYEVFVINEKIEKVVLSEQVSEYTIKEIAMKDGMVTMLQDGIIKALDGITSIDEVFRVAG